VTAPPIPAAAKQIASSTIKPIQGYLGVTMFIPVVLAAYYAGSSHQLAHNFYKPGT